MFIAHQNCTSLALCLKHSLTVYDVYSINIHVGYQGNVHVQVMLALFLEKMNIPYMYIYKVQDHEIHLGGGGRVIPVLKT